MNIQPKGQRTAMCAEVTGKGKGACVVKLNEEQGEQTESIMFRGEGWGKGGTENLKFDWECPRPFPAGIFATHADTNLSLLIALETFLHPKSSAEPASGCTVTTRTIVTIGVTSGKISSTGEFAGIGRIGAKHTGGSFTFQKRESSAMPTPPLPLADKSVSSSRFYRPELDGLRFCSFLAVFISHAYLISPRMFAHAGPITAEIGRWALAAGHCGYAAVAVFFVLSSYLITELLLREHDGNGKLDVPAFYARRALRIWPLYFFFLILMLLVEPRLGMPGIPAADAPWYLAFLGNWQIVWNGQIPRSAAQILWTVSIEEQFYLLWPLLIAFVSPKRLGWMCAALLVIGQVARLLMVASGSPFYAIHFHTLVQFDAIAWGGLLAVAVRNGALANWPVMVRRSMLLTGVVLAVVTQRLLAEDKPFSAWPVAAYPLFAIAALLVVAGAMRASEQESSWLTHPWLVRLGKISYGLYIWHLFAIVLTYKFGWCQPQSVWTSLYALPMTIAMGEISYQWIEKPFLRWKEHFSRTDLPLVAKTEPAVATATAET